MPALLAAFARLNPHATFVQVGGEAEPLRDVVVRSRWHGVVVEPVPGKAEELERTYASLGRVSVERAAVAAADGTEPFYYDPVRPSGARRREVLFFPRHFRPDLDDSVAELV